MYASFAIRGGDLYAWGQNSYGMLGLGHSSNVTSPTFVMSGVRQVVQSTTGHTLIVTEEGDLYACGRNRYGELGVTTNRGTNNHNRTPIFVMSGVRSADVGQYCSLVVKDNGELWAFGRNYYGNLTLPSTGTNTMYYPTKVLDEVAMVSSSLRTTIVLKEDGTVWAAGAGTHHARGDGSTAQRNYFTKILDDVVFITSSDYYFSFAIKNNGDVYGWGYNAYYNLGLGNTSTQPYPTYVTNNVKFVSAGYHTAFFLKEDGSLYGAGYNYYGNLGINYRYSTSTGVPYRFLRGGVTTVYGTGYHTLFLMDNGDLYTAGYNYHGNLGTGSTSPSYTHVLQKVMEDVDRLGGVQRYLLGLDGFLQPRTIHKDDILINTTLTHTEEGIEMQYRILVDDRQVFPESGWTVPRVPPFQINRAIRWTDFKLGENTVRLEVQDSEGNFIYREVTITQESTPPIIQITSPASLHKENATISVRLTDLEGDYARLKIFLNDEQIVPSVEWTNIAPTPVVETIVLPHTRFDIGVNTVRVEAEDDLGAASSQQAFIVKTNSIPSVDVSVQGTLVKALVTDLEGDPTRYRIVLNGEQVFPQAGFTAFREPPFSIEYRLTQSKVKIGEENKVKIEVRDDLGGTLIRDVTFDGMYSGLMFSDPDGEFYSTNIGEVLKYLDFGTVVAGSTTLTERVLLVNTLGFPVENVQLWVNQRELDGTLVKAEISMTDSPFIGEDELNYHDRLEHNESFGFYVRVNSDRFATLGGMFDIHVKADPA